MPVVYFKRYRMQIELSQLGPAPELRDDAIRYLPWSEKLIGPHATAKWGSFRQEIDANIFPCLGDRDGCRQLMRDISQRGNFVPESTWLAVASSPQEPELPVGTIQGLLTNPIEGAIQNVGVIPKFRGMGLGHQLLHKSLRGFQKAGCLRVNLEVTIHNTGAIRLYESIGFRCVETVFKVGNVPVNA